VRASSMWPIDFVDPKATQPTSKKYLRMKLRKKKGWNWQNRKPYNPISCLTQVKN
jgi:hypothetical protein